MDSSLDQSYRRPIHWEQHFAKSGPTYRVQVAPNATKATSHKAWNTPVKYTSWEYELDTKKFHGNKFNSIFSKKVRWQKYPWKVDLRNYRYISK